MEINSAVAENTQKEASKLVYEVSYLLLPNIGEDIISTKVNEIKNKIVSFGGSIISDENPVFIDLTYSMVKVVQTHRHKASQAYFGWVKFEMDTDNISSVDKYFKNNEEILRHLLIKTVKENTLLNGKMKLKSEDKNRKEDEEASGSDEVKEEVGEEIDKTIDDLVVA